VIESLTRQAQTLAYAHTGFFTTEAQEQLAAALTDGAPGDLTRVFFTSGGSEAMEAALKIARQVSVEMSEPGRHKVIARRQSYHGSTLGALSISGHAARRQFYAPLLFPVRHIAPCYAYRDRAPDETLEAYGLRAADELETAILEEGPGQVLAFVAEPVVGATLGCVTAVPGYFRRIRDICDRHGVLLILDEVMCGMGRCGDRFACDHDGVAPDLLTLAKGLGAGYQPIGAVLVSGKIADAIEAGSGSLRHGHTYSGHAIACAAALAVQTAIRDEGLIEAVRARGAQLAAGLRERLGGHPNVGDIRGRGLFMGLEFVADRGTKAPFPLAAGVAERVRRVAFDEGLLCYPGSGVADGHDGDHILLAPPYIISAGEVERLLDMTTTAVTRALPQ
jgi:adenosylmethionine-8-amino-7-oxononanoate aminotransferase